MKTKEVRDLLNSKLSVGDSREQVEAVLKNIDIKFSYDKYQDQYYVAIREERCDPFQGISVSLGFDKSGRLAEIKVFESYTMP